MADSPPVCFLSLEQALRLHRSLIETYGGIEGLREPGLLESALAMPKATFKGEFLHADLCAKAAAYLYHIVRNHPFLDGNKRTGAAAAIIFLALNDWEVEADEDGVVELTLAVAQSAADKQAIAAFFQSRARPLPPNAE